MKEYTFLLSKSFRSEHVKANTLREAWGLTKQWYKTLSPERKERAGSLTPCYQDCKEGDCVMSGWKQTLDKRITG